jgi:hypothetical protein
MDGAVEAWRVKRRRHSHCRSEPRNQRVFGKSRAITMDLNSHSESYTIGKIIVKSDL